jgi:glycosyltransferase involved in cell wall biosynthesis
VPAGESGPLSDALVSAVHDQELRERLFTGGHATVKRFTWAECAEEHERLYGRIIGGHL